MDVSKGEEQGVAVDTTEIYLTAATAYPALEQQFMQARSDISAGFRVFDPRTKLRSTDALQIGNTWYDLIVDTLSRGVTFRLILTDFDPVVRPAAHRMTWNAVRRLVRAGEASGRPDLLHLVPAMHPARVGIGASILLWPKTMLEIRNETQRLNRLSKPEADHDITTMPRLARHITGAHPRLRPKLSSLPRLVPTTHHQKLAVFDRQTVYLGGLDLDERRYDTPDHDRPAEETWRDCQILTSGPIAEEAKAHLDQMEHVVSGQERPAENHVLLRTMSAPQEGKPFSLAPRPVLTELEDALIHQVKTAKTLIYLETQFFRSIPFANALAQAAQSNPQLNVLILLPAAPEDVAFEGSQKSDARYGEYLQAKCLDIVATAFGKRFFATAPAQQRKSHRTDRGALKAAPLIYVHAKVAIFDDTAAIVSSANLNGRSLRWDTEVGMTLTTRKVVQDLTQRCFQHWVNADENVALAEVVPTWRARAQRNATTAPEKRSGFLLPYPIAPARRFGRNLPGVPEEMT